MLTVLMEVEVRVHDIKEAEDIKHDLEEILDDCNVTNSIEIVNVDSD